MSEKSSGRNLSDDESELYERGSELMGTSYATASPRRTILSPTSMTTPISNVSPPGVLPPKQVFYTTTVWLGIFAGTKINFAVHYTSAQLNSTNNCYWYLVGVLIHYMPAPAQ